MVKFTDVTPLIEAQLARWDRLVERGLMERISENEYRDLVPLDRFDDPVELEKPPTVKERIDRMLAEDAGFLPKSDYVIEVVLGMDEYEVKGGV